MMELTEEWLGYIVFYRKRRHPVKKREKHTVGFRWLEVFEACLPERKGGWGHTGLEPRQDAVRGGARVTK